MCSYINITNRLESKKLQCVCCDEWTTFYIPQMTSTLNLGCNWHQEALLIKLDDLDLHLNTLKSQLQYLAADNGCFFFLFSRDSIRMLTKSFVHHRHCTVMMYYFCTHEVIRVVISNLITDVVFIFAHDFQSVLCKKIIDLLSGQQSTILYSRLFIIYTSLLC